MFNIYHFVNISWVVFIGTLKTLAVIDYKELVNKAGNYTFELVKNTLTSLNSLEYKETVNRLLSYVGQYEIRIVFILCLLLLVAKILFSIRNIEKELHVFERHKNDLRAREMEFTIRHDAWSKKKQAYTSRLDCFIENYYSKNRLIQGIEDLIEQSTVLSENARKWQITQSALETSENAIANKKLKDIENIMIDGAYNDPDYLLFSDMTMAELKIEAKELDIPRCSWGSKQALAYSLRLTHKLNDLIAIVNPVYPDGYETEPMEE